MDLRLGIYDVYNGIKMPNLEIFKEILDFNNISYKILNIRDENFWDQIHKIDLLIYKWPNNDNHHLLANILMPVFESLNIQYYPDRNTTWHFDDKVKQYYLLSLHGANPVNSHIFFHRDKALEFSGDADYPFVAKLSKGASSSNVRLIKNRGQAFKYIRKAFGRGFRPQYFGSFSQLAKTKNLNPRKIADYYMHLLKRRIYKRDTSLWAQHKNYIYFQDYLPGNSYDTRVTTVGDRVHAFRRFSRKNDFRASGAEEWDVNPSMIDKRMLRIALDFSKKMGFQTMAYDFIYDERRNPRIVEISYLYGQPGYPDFMNGYWDFDLNWIEGRFWPQYFELVDILGIPDLKCPDIRIPEMWLTNKII